ncbi:MAG: TonB-dependent receptor [Gammaproteobacteria bacterium]|nr:TonB-dependent receptor [Gammaproteobacteria bacterium]
MKLYVLLPVLPVMLFSGSSAIAEEVEKLTDVTVTATRVDKSLYEIPASVGYVGIDDIQFGTEQIGLDESLDKIPGIFSTNRYNFNQDLRISIRGFGSRSTFGIRGVRIYVDGIPNTLPDGQGGVDSIDLGSTASMEVIRGPSSSIYGTASGGVINIYTEDGPSVGHTAKARMTMGSDGMKKAQVKTGGQLDALNYLVSFSRFHIDGYRDNSESDNFLLNSKFRYDFSDRTDLTMILNMVDSPEANDPGGLCSNFNPTPFCTSFIGDRTVAQRNNERFDAGEAINQQQVGFVFNHVLDEYQEITARNYYVLRDFEANLPFGAPFAAGGIIGLDRFFLGGGLQYINTHDVFGHGNRITVGFDVDSQMDDRVNYTNIRDDLANIGPLTLKQDEDVFNWGVYVQNEFDITETVQLTAGIRYDEVEFEFTDFFLADDDQSGSVTFSEWSPQVGLLWQAHEAINPYVSYSTSFETPSTREFASPVGPGGFNTSLTSQVSTNYEVGVKGILPAELSYQLSVFHIDTEDELLPAGLNAGGSTFFINAGETERFGVEAAFTYRILPGLELSMAYTYSDFEFKKLLVNGLDFAGDKIPGIPEQNFYSELAYYHPDGFYAAFELQYVDEIHVNNTYVDDRDFLITQIETANDYLLGNLRLGYSMVDADGTEFNPFIGINNIFDQKYFGNIRVNEGNRRFFEPAPELNIFAGVAIGFDY